MRVALGAMGRVRSAKTLVASLVPRRVEDRISRNMSYHTFRFPVWSAYATIVFVFATLRHRSPK